MAHKSGKSSFEEPIRCFARQCLEGKYYKKDFYRSFLGAVEKPFLETVMKISCGSQLRAARILDVNRNTLRERLKKLKIDYKKYR